jgi:hypothetical protein
MKTRVDILFFSRGKGRGHAIPDLSVATAIRKLQPNTILQFVSYGTGAEVLKANHENIVEIRADDDSDDWARCVAAGSALRNQKPKLVVCHEEPGVVLLAKSLGYRVVYMTHWFASGAPFARALGFVDHVLYSGLPGLFKEPPEVSGRITYTGTLLRSFDTARLSCLKVRRQLGISKDTVVVLFIPGSWPVDSAKIIPLVLQAFRALPVRNKRMLWIADKASGPGPLSESESRQISIIENCFEIQDYMLVSDIAITQGTYNTTMELRALGTRSIALSFGTNPIDDIIAKSLQEVCFLNAQQCSTASVLTALERSIAASPLEGISSDLLGLGCQRTASLIVANLHKWSQSSTQNL